MFFPAAFSIAKNGRQSASDKNGFGKAAEDWFGCQLSYGKKYVGTWRSVPCSPTEEGFGAMKEWTTPLDGLEPGEKYLICVRARNQTPGVEPEEETSPWGKWSDRSEAIATSGKGKGVADAGKAVGGKQHR